MNKIYDGGPAFARPAFAPEGVRYEDCEITESQEGMSLRCWLAGKAMQGLIAKYGVGEDPFHRPELDDPAHPPSEYVLALRKHEAARLQECRRKAAAVACEMADELLAELEKQQ